MNRIVYKIFVAFWTNLIGLLLVQAFIGTRAPRQYTRPHLDHDVAVIEAADSWRPAQAGLPSPGQVEGPEPSDHTMSPFGLRALLNGRPYGTNLEPIWSWFGVRSALPPRCSGCTAEVFQLELDAEPGVETVLRIGNDKTRYQYLFFKYAHSRTNPSGWKFLGLVDDITYKHEAPPHFTATAGNHRHWFVVQGQAELGSGAVNYRNRVFEVTPSGVAEVLAYPSSGYHVGGPGQPERSFDTLLLETDSDRRGQTMKVQYTAYYFEEGRRLLTRQQTALFARPAGARQFALDPRRSDLSREEFAAVYDSAMVSGDDFLKYNHEELTRVAVGDDEAARDWLRNLVHLQGPTQRAQALARLLER